MQHSAFSKRAIFIKNKRNIILYAHFYTCLHKTRFYQFIFVTTFAGLVEELAI